MVPKPSSSSSRSPASFTSSSARQEAPSSPARQEVEAWIETTCQAVIRGRKSSWQVSAWARAVGLSEVEWQLLWLLSGIPRQKDGPPATAVESLEYASHQTELAAKLVVSPAQISACVGRLDAEGLILGRRPQTDRRRQLWRISDRGRSLVERVITMADVRTALDDAQPPGNGPSSNSYSPPAPPASRAEASPPAA